MNAALTVDVTLVLVAETGPSDGMELGEAALKAVRGGATAVLYRNGGVSRRAMVEDGRYLRELLGPLGIPILVHEHLDVALLIGAAGIYLEQTGVHPRDAHELLGPEACIGVAIENLTQARESYRLPIDFLAVAPLFADERTDYDAAWNSNGLRILKECSALPLVGFGGITPWNAREVFEAGADGVGLSCAGPLIDDPESAAQIVRTLADSSPDRRSVLTGRGLIGGSFAGNTEVSRNGAADSGRIRGQSARR